MKTICCTTSFPSGFSRSKCSEPAPFSHGAQIDVLPLLEAKLMNI